MLIRKISASCLAILGSVAFSGVARAQGQPTTTTPPGTISPGNVPRTLNPGGGGDERPPPAPEPEKQPIIVNVPGPDGKLPEGESEEEEGFYYRDDQGLMPTSGLRGVRGPVPETHVVRSGDTLWDLCGFYFNNPWEWPRVWSYNPSITNPHWIYPGDLVRLYEPSTGPIAPTPSEERPEPTSSPGETATVSRRGFRLRKLAFVDTEGLDDAMIVDGSSKDKLMMSLGDEIYLRYSNDNKPQVGKRYSVYETVEKVTHPKTGKKVGAYVQIHGDVEVRSAKKDRRARAVVLRSSKPIERGQMVGPIKKNFKNVEPVRNERSLQGFIVGKIDRGELIGARQLVLIDLGKKAGIKEGNRLYIVRRGDAYPELTDPLRSVGQDDKRFPARALGEVVVVDVGESISLALVTLVVREVGVGDMVLMRKDTR